MTSKAQMGTRGRWRNGLAGKLPSIVSVSGSAKAQLRQERRKAAHHALAGGAAVLAHLRQRSPSVKTVVAPRAVAGHLATGSPFMDIGIPCLLRAPSALGGALDGPDPLRVALSVARRISGVFLPVAVVLAALGSLFRRRVAPFFSSPPASPFGSFPAAGGATVLGAKAILRPWDEVLSTALQKARAADGGSVARKLVSWPKMG